jgi:hypothetical protein
MTYKNCPSWKISPSTSSNFEMKYFHLNASSMMVTKKVWGHGVVPVQANRSGCITSNYYFFTVNQYP